MWIAGLAALIAAFIAASAAALPARALSLLLAAPVLEEIIFRVGLQQALLQRFEQQGRSATLAVNAATAVAFATAHWLVQASALAALTLLPALVIGALYQRQRRLLPCIALHGLFNSLWLLWTFA